MREADAWKNQCHCGQQSANEQAEPGVEEFREKILRQSANEKYDYESKNKIKEHIRRNSLDAALFFNGRNPAKNSSQKEIEGLHRVMFQEPGDRSGTDYNAHSCAGGEEKEKYCIFLNIFPERADRENQFIINAKNQRHGTATDTGDNHGWADEKAFEKGDNKCFVQKVPPEIDSMKPLLNYYMLMV